MKEQELFDVEENEEIGNEGMELEIDEENEMELEIDSEEEMADLEKIVSEKVEEEIKENKKEKSKRGPKGPRKDKSENKKEETKSKEKKVDLTSIRVLEKEVKKGNITCPQGRIEKTDDNNYKMLLAPQPFVRTADLKFEDVGTVEKLVKAKEVITLKAAEKFGDIFQHTDSDGNVVKHDWVRVELHKPGRDKDVVELYKVSWAKGREEDTLKREQKKKEEEEKKAAKKKEDQEQQNQEEKE